MLRIYVKKDTNTVIGVDGRTIRTDSAGRKYIDVPDNILFAEIPEEIPDENILWLSYLDNIQTPPERSRGVYTHGSVRAVVKDLSPKAQARPGTLGLIITGEPTPERNLLSVFLDMRELYSYIMDGTAVEKGLLHSWENEEKEPKNQESPTSANDYGEMATETGRE